MGLPGDGPVRIRKRSARTVRKRSPSLPHLSCLPLKGDKANLLHVFQYKLAKVSLKPTKKKEESGPKIDHAKEPPPEKPSDKGFQTRTIQKGGDSPIVTKDIVNQEPKK